MRRHNFTFENFAQENGQKISKHEVGKNRKKVKKQIKIMNFPACIYKSKKYAQSQQYFARLHDIETVTFKNSVDTAMNETIKIFAGPKRGRLT